MYQPDTGLKVLWGRWGAVVVLVGSMILAAATGTGIDEKTQEIVVTNIGAMIQTAGAIVAAVMAAVSKMREKKKIDRMTDS